MLRNILILTLVVASTEVARAQSLTITDTTIRESVNRHAASAVALQRTRYGRPCDPKRRVLAGAAIGFVAGMVVINRIAAEYDSSVGVKGTLGVGAYGAALGALVGLRTCL